MLLTTVGVLCVSMLGSAVVADDVRAADDQHQPLKVLLLAGGGYHDFETNPFHLSRGMWELQSDAMVIQPLWLGGEPPQTYQTSRSIDDPGLFDQYDVVLAYMQGELGVSDAAKARLLEYIRNGGGFVAIHSAADSFPGWDEYTTMLGGRFESHPPFGEIAVQVDVTEHDITRGLPTQWVLQDEFYHLKDCRTDDKLVLMTGRSPGDAEDAPLRPVAWEKNYGHGRVFYTILGHDHHTFEDERFHQLIFSAIEWAADAPKPDENGVYHLFDGKSLNGWSMAGPGRFRIDDGQLVAEGGMGLLWYSERRFRDFTLSVQWQAQDASDNSGIFVRFPKPSDDPWYSVNHGHEIQIYDAPSAGETRRTGSVYGYAPASDGASLPPGEWNQFEITVRGHEYTIKLNGQLVCQWSCPPERHGREGYIGLQNHSSPVRFRNITVKELR